MPKVMGHFIRYACVGVANTAIHAGIFFGLVVALGVDQGPANAAAFLLAASAGYCLNAHFTFKAAMAVHRYALYVSLMALAAWGVGTVAHRAGLAPWLTFFAFSGLSLLLGFGVSRWLVFTSGSKAC